MWIIIQLAYLLGLDDYIKQNRDNPYIVKESTDEIKVPEEVLRMALIR